MNREQLLEELFRQNPWWEGSAVPLPEPLVERELLDDVVDGLEEDIVTAVTGVRRAGKTTLLHTAINACVGETEPEQVLYFSFDRAEETDILEVVQAYQEEILGTTFAACEERVYIFLDEVQNCANWSAHVKSVYDRGYDVKFVVTGSSSMRMTKGAGESLVGRIEVHELQPFSFRSYCGYHGTDPPAIDLDDLSYPPSAQQLRILFQQYLDDGGFPELYADRSEEHLQQNLDLTLFRDIVKMFPVKRSDILTNLFRLVAEHTGQVVNYNSLSRDLDTQYRTVTDYLQYLEDAFLIRCSPPQFASSKKEMRKNPKLYVADHSYNRLYPANEGLVAETVAFNHLRNVEEPRFMKEPEVDIVLPESGNAFEVKYGETVEETDAAALVELPPSFDCFLVTRKTFDKWEVDGRDVQLLPLWMLCLTVSGNG